MNTVSVSFSSSRDLLDISPTLTEAAGAIVDVSERFLNFGFIPEVLIFVGVDVVPSIDLKDR